MNEEGHTTAPVSEQGAPAVSVECSLAEIRSIAQVLRIAQVQEAQDKVIIGQLQGKWEQLVQQHVS